MTACPSSCLPRKSTSQPVRNFIHRDGTRQGTFGDDGQELERHGNRVLEQPQSNRAWRSSHSARCEIDSVALSTRSGPADRGIIRHLLGLVR